jgi:hypothetical protein
MGMRYFWALTYICFFFNDINKTNPRKYITDKKKPISQSSKEKIKKKRVKDPNSPLQGICKYLNSFN